MDESGSFEIRQNEIRFVGGLSKVTDDHVSERNKLFKFLKGACDEFNKGLAEKKKPWRVKYPVSLHGMDNNVLLNERDGKKPDWKSMSSSQKNDYEKLTDAFKDHMEKGLINYLRENGYKLFCTVDTGQGKNYGVDNVYESNLLKLDVGANFYEAIAGEMLCNEIFYDIDGCYDRYYLELATRTAPIKEKDLKEFQELYDTARNDEKSKDPYRGYITDKKYYNAFITAKIQESVEKYDTFSRCQFSFNVNPINYKDDKNAEKDAEKDAFLYAADIVCGYIRNTLKKKKPNAQYRYTSRMFLGVTQKEEISLHIYNKLMLMYQEMYENIEAVRLDQYYSLRYEIEQMEDEPYFADFYRKNWIAYLDQCIEDRLMKNKEFCMQIRDRMDGYIGFIQSFVRVDHPNYEKGLFIAERVAAIVHLLDIYSNKGKDLFELYDIILGCVNHRGATSESAIYVQKCDIYKRYVPLERYFEHILKVMQFYYNSFLYREEYVYNVCEKQIDIVFQLKEMYGKAYDVSLSTVKGIVDTEESGQLPKSPLWGKFFSSAGQLCGFMHKFKEGYLCFEAALGEYRDGLVEMGSQKDGGRYKGNYGISMCHYLHLLIENNDKTKYEELSRIYFGTGQLEQQLDRLLVQKGLGDIGPFGLFVYIKAFRVFYADEAHREIFRSLLDRLAGLEKGNYNEHPWELIYKNVSEILMKYDDQGGFNKSFIENNTIDLLPEDKVEDTIKIIQLGFRLNYGEHYEPTSVEKGICTRLGLMKDGDTVDALRSKLNEILTYEYC